MAKQQNRKDKVSELIILLILLIISFFLWDMYFIYPIKLFVVLLHELSHSLAAILSGGKITTLDIGFDLSGKCETVGGNTIIIASSGYIGSLIWGLLFFVSPNNKKIGKWLIISLSTIIFLLSITFSADSIFILLAFILSGLLITAAFFLGIPIVTIIVRSFGLISCVYVLFDIKEDLLSNSSVISDASILSSLINVQVIWIGLSWALVSIIGIYFAIKYSYRKVSD
ncbi:MAG: M50 family metallopeptidase [Ignavibacteriales bacterium]|nr:M50 family metallopeptidase [Ignavibacteriales bacterium]